MGNEVSLDGRGEIFCLKSSRLGLGLGLTHTLINVYVLLTTSVHLQRDRIGEYGN